MAMALIHLGASVATLPLAIVGTVLSPVITVGVVAGAVVGTVVVGTAVVVGGTAVVVGGGAAAAVGGATYGGYRLHKNRQKKAAKQRDQKERAFLELRRHWSNKICIEANPDNSLFPTPVKLPCDHVAFGLGWGSTRASSLETSQLDYDLFATVFDREGNLIETVIGAEAEARFLDGALIHSGNVASSQNLHEKGIMRENENLYVHTNRLGDNVGAIVVGCILQSGSMRGDAYLNCIPIAGITELDSVESVRPPEGSDADALQKAYDDAKLFEIGLGSKEFGDQNAYLACKIVRIDEGGWALAPVRISLDAFAVDDIIPEMIEVIRPQIEVRANHTMQIDCVGGQDSKVMIDAFDQFGYQIEHKEYQSNQDINLSKELLNSAVDVYISVDRGTSATAGPVIGKFNICQQEESDPNQQFSFGVARFQIIGRITSRAVPARRPFSPSAGGSHKLVPYAMPVTVSDASQLVTAIRRTYNPEVATSLVFTIIGGYHLEAADIGNSSDPYVVVHRLQEPNQKTSKATSIFKTTTIKGTLYPTWEEGFTVQLDAGWATQPLFKFCLWDKDFGSADDKLGHIIVDLRQEKLPTVIVRNVQNGRGQLLISCVPTKGHAIADHGAATTTSSSSTTV